MTQHQHRIEPRDSRGSGKERARALDLQKAAANMRFYAGVRADSPSRQVVRRGHLKARKQHAAEQKAEALRMRR